MVETDWETDLILAQQYYTLCIDNKLNKWATKTFLRRGKYQVGEKLVPS
jgi:hypothetical protein